MNESINHEALVTLGLLNTVDSIPDINEEGRLASVTSVRNVTPCYVLRASS